MSMISEHLNDAAAVRTDFETWLHTLIVSKTVMYRRVNDD